MLFLKKKYLLRYDSDRSRFEDVPVVEKSDDSDLKFCPSCVRIRDQELVCRFEKLFYLIGSDLFFLGNNILILTLI